MEMTVEAFAVHPQDGVGQSPKRSSTRPVDLVHLARYTLGDNMIEREVLGLFRRQSQLFLQRLNEAVSHTAWRQAAHTIKDSALGIGAWRIAKTAEYAEALEGDALSERHRWVIQDLEQRIEEANGFIGSLLADA